MKRLYSQGDTLIEVMISLAIVSLVLGLSYATASRALRTGRAAQERTEAQKLVEGQLELLKFMADSNMKTLSSLPINNEIVNSPASVFGSMYVRGALNQQSFCLDRSGATIALTPQSMIVADQYVDPADNYDMSYNPNGAPTSGQTYHRGCVKGYDNRYKLSIERTDNTVGPEIVSVFSVRARWERIGGGKDEVKMVYRLNRGQFRP